MSDEELDMLVASFFCITEDDEPEDIGDLEILTDEDRSALNALGDDLVDRLLEANP